MPELNNSQRRLYKATYAPTRPSVSGQDSRRFKLLMRGVEKSRFVESLAIHPVELRQMRSLALEDLSSAPARKRLQQVLDVVESQVNDTAPDASTRHAQEISQVPADALLEFGRQLARQRRAAVETVKNHISEVRSAYEKAGQAAAPSRMLASSPSPVEMPRSAPQVDIQGETPSGMAVRLRRFESGFGSDVPRGAAQDASAGSRGTANQAAANRAAASRADANRANANRANATRAASRRVVFNMQRVPRVESAAFASAGAEANAVTKAFLLEAALRWASDSQPHLLEPLVTLAQQISPIPQAYNTLGYFENVEDALSKVDKWAEHTHWLVDSFQERMKIDPIGRLHLERLEMTPAGIERGELVYSVPLAPQETVNLTHKEWATTSEEFEKIVQDSFEGYSEQGVTEKNELTQSTESQSKHNTALDLGATVTGSYGTVTVSASAGYHSASDDMQSQKDSRNHSITLTRKASSRVKKDHKMTFKVASASGTEDQAVRVITNPSATDALRIDYYQLLRKWRVDLQRYGLRMTYDIVIPNPGGDLRRMIDEIRSLDEQINRPFYFPVTVDMVKRDTWYDLSATYNGQVEPPKDEEDWIITHKEFKPPSDPKDMHFDFLEFEVPDDYQVEEANLLVDLAILPMPSDDSEAWFPPYANIEYEPNDPDGERPFLSSMDNLLNKSGKLSIVFYYTDAGSGAAQAWVKIHQKDSAYLAWQYKAWSALRQAAEEAYYQQRESLREHRSELLEEIGKYDALTLRRMEREEIMKGVLRWLFGPSFELVPWDIQSLFEPTWDNPSVYDVKDLNTLSQQEWMRMMKFGEFIKYIHQAIEWENVLFFTYPYFWNTPDNWNALRFLDHPDALHRVFLRAGAARVVLTLRPGFEDSFSSFVETGAFDQLPEGHPYVTIAQEIQNFANTNYPGIPPANKAVRSRPLLYPEQRKSWEDMQKILRLLDAYQQANGGAYPTTAQGLAALAPYTNADIPNVPTKDAWGNDFQYTSPALTGDFEVVSLGADGAPGGDDLDADISSSSESSLIATWYEYTPTSALDISLNTVLADLQG